MRNRHWGADEDCSSTDGDGVSYTLRFFFCFFFIYCRSHDNCSSTHMHDEFSTPLSQQQDLKCCLSC